jgi:hypothetical protein
MTVWRGWLTATPKNTDRADCTISFLSKEYVEHRTGAIDCATVPDSSLKDIFARPVH